MISPHSFPVHHGPNNYFLAVRPDFEAAFQTARQAAVLRKQHSLRTRSLSANLFHVTLHALGHFTEPPLKTLTMVCAVMRTLVAQPFDVEFDRIMSFSSRNPKQPLVMLGGAGVVALTNFQRRIGRALWDNGLRECVNRNFTPHMTLLYGDKSIPEHFVNPIRWTVNECVLVRSLVGQSQHLIVERWVLQR